MAYARLGSHDVIQARVSFPRAGAWTAILIVDTDTRLAGRTRLTIGDAGFNGTIQQASVYSGVSHVRMVGGSGGLATELPAKSYLSTPVRVPLQDIAQEAGEVLSAKCDSTVTLKQLRHWARAQNRAGHCLHVLTEDVDAVWRFLTDGTLWVGKETWPQSKIAGEYDSYHPMEDSLSMFSLTPGVQPGTVFLGRKVGHVEHEVSDSKVRTKLWFEAEA